MNRIHRRLYRLCWLLVLLPGLPAAAAAAGPAAGESPPRGQEPAASSGREEAEVNVGVAVRSIRLVSLAAQEQRAVIRTADPKLVVVRVGEPLDSAPGWTVSEILSDRIVLDDGGQRQAWILEPERPGEPSRVVLIDRRPPEKEIAPKPISSGTPTAPNDQL